MKRIHLIMFFLVALAASSCTKASEEVAPNPAPPPKAAKKIQIEPVVVQQEQPKKYKYEINGRRDPFEPLVVVARKPVPSDANEPLTPLQSYELESLRLIAVIIGKGPSSAMIMAPDGKGYILKKGIKVGKNNGSVIGIRPDAVIVEEKYMDFSGEIKKRTQEIQLPKREGA